MPGFFGGNSKDEQEVKEIAATPPPYMADYQPGVNKSQPGQIDMLAQNLAAGGFGMGDPAALKNWMNTFYTQSPMMIYGGPKPAAAPAAAVAAPSAAPKAKINAKPAINQRYGGYGHYAGNATGTGDEWLFGGGKNSR